MSLAFSFGKDTCESARQNASGQPIRRQNSRTDAIYLPEPKGGFDLHHVDANARGQRGATLSEVPRNDRRKVGLAARNAGESESFLISLHQKSANNHTSGPPKRSGVHQDTNAFTGATFPAACAAELIIPASHLPQSAPSALTGLVNVHLDSKSTHKTESFAQPN